MFHRKQFIDKFHHQDVAYVIVRIGKDVPHFLWKEIAVIRLLAFYRFKIFIEHLVSFERITEYRDQKIIISCTDPGADVQHPFLLQSDPYGIPFGFGDLDASYHGNPIAVTC